MCDGKLLADVIHGYTPPTRARQFAEDIRGAWEGNACTGATHWMAVGGRVHMALARWISRCGTWQPSAAGMPLGRTYSVARRGQHRGRQHRRGWLNLSERDLVRDLSCSSTKEAELKIKVGKSGLATRDASRRARGYARRSAARSP